MIHPLRLTQLVAGNEITVTVAQRYIMDTNIEASQKQAWTDK
jgi:hypothetical protein